MNNWYPLDNAAKIFPALITPRNSTVFRYSVQLNTPIDRAMLENALRRALVSVPHFRVRMRNGLFWQFLEGWNGNVPIQKEHFSPCRPLGWRDGHYLFRVLYYCSSITVEFSHSLTDATGAKKLFCELIETYVDPERTVSLVSDEQRQKLQEDSYLQWFTPNLPIPTRPETALHVKTPFLPHHARRLIVGEVSFPAIKNCATVYGVSITEYLTALYIFSLNTWLEQQVPHIRRRRSAPIRIQVPVNLRRFYPSETGRNFFLTVMPGIDPRLGEYSFEEICQTVHHQMRFQVNEKMIRQQMSRNVLGEQHPLIRIVPLFLKLPLERFLYGMFGNRHHSGILSNIGSMSFSPLAQKQIQSLYFATVPNERCRTTVGVVSMGDTLSITFSSVGISSEVERIFFSELRKWDIPVKVISNE